MDTDPLTGITVVKVECGDPPPAKLDRSRNLAVGQPPVAIGSPSGFESTMTSGVGAGGPYPDAR